MSWKVSFRDRLVSLFQTFQENPYFSDTSLWKEVAFAETRDFLVEAFSIVSTTSQTPAVIEGGIICLCANKLGHLCEALPSYDLQGCVKISHSSNLGGWFVWSSFLGFWIWLISFVRTPPLGCWTPQGPYTPVFFNILAGNSSSNRSPVGCFFWGEPSN